MIKKLWWWQKIQAMWTILGVQQEHLRYMVPPNGFTATFDSERLENIEKRLDDLEGTGNRNGLD